MRAYSSLFSEVTEPDLSDASDPAPSATLVAQSKINASSTWEQLRRVDDGKRAEATVAQTLSLKVKSLFRRGKRDGGPPKSMRSGSLENVTTSEPELLGKYWTGLRAKFQAEQLARGRLSPVRARGVFESISEPIFKQDKSTPPFESTAYNWSRLTNADYFIDETQDEELLRTNLGQLSHLADPAFPNDFGRALERTLTDQQRDALKKNDNVILSRPQSSALMISDGPDDWLFPQIPDAQFRALRRGEEVTFKPDQIRALLAPEVPNFIAPYARSVLNEGRFDGLTRNSGVELQASQAHELLAPFVPNSAAPYFSQLLGIDGSERSGQDAQITLKATEIRQLLVPEVPNFALNFVKSVIYSGPAIRELPGGGISVQADKLRKLTAPTIANSISRKLEGELTDLQRATLERNNVVTLSSPQTRSLVASEGLNGWLFPEISNEKFDALRRGDEVTLEPDQLRALLKSDVPNYAAPFAQSILGDTGLDAMKHESSIDLQPSQVLGLMAPVVPNPAAPFLSRLLGIDRLNDVGQDERFTLKVVEVRQLLEPEIPNPLRSFMPRTLTSAVLSVATGAAQGGDSLTLNEIEIGPSLGNL